MAAPVATPGAVRQDRHDRARSHGRPSWRFAIWPALCDLAPEEVTMAAKKKARKYGKRAAAKDARVMHERKGGTLRSGRSGKKVTSRKQAIAIGLSEARKEGDK